jgi:GTPase
MNLPIVTIFTKTDLVPFERTKQLVKEYKAILSDLDKFPIKIKSIDDIVLICRNIRETNFVPIFKVSNVKWEGLNLLKSFLSMLPVYMTELENIDTESLEVSIILNIV